MKNKYSCHIAIADKYGFNVAMIYSYIDYWCEYNRKHNMHQHDGTFWVFRKIEQFQEVFPCLSKHQVVTSINKLVNEGLVVKAHIGEGLYGNTLAYAITKKGYDMSNIQFEPQTKRQISGGTKAKKQEKRYQIQTNKSRKLNIQNTENQSDLGEKPEFLPISIKDNHCNNNNYNNNYNNIREEGCGCDDVGNPYGEGNEGNPPDTVYRYASENLITLGYRAMQELEDFADELSEAVVRHAIDNALDNGVKTWNYVKSILNNYADANVKTVGDAKKFDEERRRRKTEKAEYQRQQNNTSEDSPLYGKFY